MSKTIAQEEYELGESCLVPERMFVQGVAQAIWLRLDIRATAAYHGLRQAQVACKAATRASPPQVRMQAHQR